ncbi:integrase_H2C2 domain-containing protein [Trichonephila clavata]|uniref:Integrase_H2C2 domain-containing protein n=1 Tax=Trichonephila clavata TaxID=2740835 RepID=A0A8X6FZV4_TRICU|nr:integrase_H2C2 domain-containing protein [Trichonephila clavata]
MQLHKWSSNCIELLSNFDVSVGDVSLTIHDETKALGLLWIPQKDTSAFSVSCIADVSDSCTITKMPVLSVTARIFDPLGLICVLWWSPCDISEIDDNDLYLREFKKSNPVCLVTQNVELLQSISAHLL